MKCKRVIHYVGLLIGVPAYCKERRAKKFTVWLKVVTCKRCKAVLKRKEKE